MFLFAKLICKQIEFNHKNVSQNTQNYVYVCVYWVLGQFNIETIFLYVLVIQIKEYKNT